MPYPSRNRSYVWLGVIFIVLIILHFTKILSPVERAIRSLVGPFLGELHTMSIEVNDQYQFFRNKEEFISAYQVCMVGTEKQTILAADNKRLLQENEELKNLLAFTEKTTPKHTMTRVIGKAISSIEQTIIIDRGSSDQIMPGQPVVANNGILVGKVIKTEPDVSIVRLINDNQSRIAATVLNSDRSLGVVEGGFGISLQMNLIPRDELVQVGDIIVTSGLETGVPRGLVLGTVASIENEAYKPFQRAILTPGTELDKISIVSVLSTE